MFSGRSQNKMAIPSSDWLRPFWLPLLNHWMELNETWREARSQRPLPSVCFSGRIGNENCRPGRSVKKVAHCTEVYNMSPLVPIVFIIYLKAYKLVLWDITWRICLQDWKSYFKSLYKTYIFTCFNAILLKLLLKVVQAPKSNIMLNLL